MTELTHFNAAGEAHIVDIGAKATTHRVATAEGCIVMQATTVEKIRQGTHKKGDVLGIARIAGIMAAKKTADLIPLCHPLALTHIDISFEIQTTADQHQVYCQAKVATQGQTGVEMEALTAVHIALLTIYDMCKAVDKTMSMANIRVIQKMGGKSGDWQHPDIKAE